ncbi:helix-turn-helix domain-containing protein [Mucilaginibacter sp. SG564]|uniref:AraC family transcriptional regulator n=1 Tax=unclassified Mucilaginibacter TaxID=2617802 RepID=UPI001554DFA5|nr:helix-turn-helix domain-containing protein [Mucilaginibacter sp. SG564]NOW95309.1 AraC-like DNA-binding protein [Mucilaginibacter sp. SG564]
MVEIFQDIRKIYMFSRPCEELLPHIEFYSQSVLDHSAQDIKHEFSTVKMFPSWTPTFYINLGSPYYIDLKNTRHYVKGDEDILILRNEDVTRHKLPADNIFTVKFNPGGLEAILGLNQVWVMDKIIPLHQVLPWQLLQKIKQPISFEERVQIVQSYLLAAYHQLNNQDHYVKMVNDSIGEYRAAGMQLNTSQVAEKLFITSKTINRYFNRVIGISPKNYFSILRGRIALTSFMKDKENFIPMDYGYYDLSHFHKDIVNFTGQRLTKHL